MKIWWMEIEMGWKKINESDGMKNRTFPKNF